MNQSVKFINKKKNIDEVRMSTQIDRSFINVEVILTLKNGEKHNGFIDDWVDEADFGVDGYSFGRIFHDTNADIIPDADVVQIEVI